MHVQWMTAFVDHPPAATDAVLRFWQTVTGSTPSSRRGERDEFATLLPPDGDSHLRIQATEDHSAGVHIDLHVDDVPGAAGRAQHIGASLVNDAGTDDGLAVMRSPAGMSFCFVGALAGKPTRSAPVEGPGGSCTFDQVSIDIPFERFAAECDFWSDLTGWPLHGGSVAEFRVLERPTGMALRILLQQLGPDDPGVRARAHLDAAVGSNGEAIAAWHESLGARRLGRGRHWITLADPAGLPYCLTERDPVGGSLPPHGPS